MILIKNQKLQAALEKVGLGYVKLYKDNGYFFISSDNNEMCETIYGLKSTMIYMNSFNQQSVNEWVNDIQMLFNNQY